MVRRRFIPVFDRVFGITTIHTHRVGKVVDAAIVANFEFPSFVLQLTQVLRRKLSIDTRAEGVDPVFGIRIFERLLIK
jgi:hypothetical protein